jgi:addiction module antitoxin, relB/dinJ family
MTPTNARSAEIKTRTTAQIKADASKVYAHWGISLSDAINIFLTKSIEVGGLPFDMRPSAPSFDGLERYAYHPRLDPNGVATLPGDWDEDE